MISITEATEYFGNCKNKHISRFDEKTPEGNHISGWICRKPNKYLGSLLIDTVNNEPHLQFIQSMPKIEYFQHEQDISFDNDIICYEKLDGSCLITYPLLDEHNKIIEIIPKTRGRAVADNNFIELYNKIDKTSIYHYYRENTGILMFELYGILNQHEIIHYNTGIDIVLIGCYDNDEFAKPMDLWLLSMRHLFRQPDEIFKINHDKTITISSYKYKHYLNDIPYEELCPPTVYDDIDTIKNILEYLNNSFNSINGRIATEGVVINCSDINGEQKYIKIKPPIILNNIAHEKGIPRKSITKECLKYFDEYGSQIIELYNTDKKHHIEYINRMLSEEYDSTVIAKSSKKIEKIFMQIWESKIPPVSMHNLAEELYDELHTEGISACMRAYGERYPMKKKDARTFYSVLEKIFKKHEGDEVDYE